MQVAITQAISIAGSQSALARLIGVRQGHVWAWIQTGIPADRVLAVSRATDWRVTPHQLRPDIYPNPTDGLPPEGAEQHKEAS